MALTYKSMFLYGYQVTENNASLDFRAVSGGPVLLATLNLGFYSLTSLGEEIVRAMQVADPDNEYTVSVNRTINGGLENRVSISTNGVYLDLLFSSGPRSASSIAPLIGFNITDRTGGLLYTGNNTSGTVLIPDFIGYNYLSPDYHQTVFGSVNISASGQKEAIVFNFQKFIQVQFKYESKAKITPQWLPFMQWAIQQRLFEFTPDLTDPNTFYEVTLEKSSGDGKGLGFKFQEMLPQFPNLYDTGLMTFRQRNT